MQTDLMEPAIHLIGTLKKIKKEFSLLFFFSKCYRCHTHTVRNNGETELIKTETRKKKYDFKKKKREKENNKTQRFDSSAE